MEDVLDLYALLTDPSMPRACFDECPYQLLDEVREPLPPQPGKPKRQDCEYEREGTCNLFLFLEPNVGWRQVQVTKRHTKQDFAQAMKDLPLLLDGGNFGEDGDLFGFHFVAQPEGSSCAQ